MRERLRRRVVTFDEMISGRPRPENAAGAFCMICRKPVETEQLVEEHRSPFRQSAKVLVRCHGAEELATFEMGRQDWDHTDLKRAMQRKVWFDPEGHDGKGMRFSNGDIKGD